MHIIVVGLNHKTSPIEFREQFFFPADQLQVAMRSLREIQGVLECVILSTCNRTELYVVCDHLHKGENYINLFLQNWFSIAEKAWSRYLYIKKDSSAALHLMQVVCGLDSLILGETQILGQIRDAFLTAQAEGTVGTIFNQLFKQAITLGKRVHTETAIGQNAVSVSYAAVELGKKMFNTFEDKSIMFIGAGKMIELTAKYFCVSDRKRLLFLNRTFSKAENLAVKFGGQAVPWEQLHRSLAGSDIIISCTGSNIPIITRAMLERAMCYRDAPIFIFDIAVPRDIDPRVHTLRGVFLHNIDDLYRVVDLNKTLRLQEAEKVYSWVEEECIRFQEWMATLRVTPLIAALREKAITVQEEAMNRIERKITGLTEYEKMILHKQTRSIVNQLLREPIMQLKELAITQDQGEALDMFVQMFALKDEGTKIKKDRKLVYIK